MGLSSMPAARDSLLAYVLYNTAVSIAIVAGLVRSALVSLGLADRFRSRFGRRHAGADCRVCLDRFEPESVVNRLPCGHLFHRSCLETWLDYDHATCPLCRHRLTTRRRLRRPASAAHSPAPPPGRIGRRR